MDLVSEKGTAAATAASAVREAHTRERAESLARTFSALAVEDEDEDDDEDVDWEPGEDEEDEEDSDGWLNEDDDDDEARAAAARLSRPLFCCSLACLSLLFRI